MRFLLPASSIAAALIAAAWLWMSPAGLIHAPALALTITDGSRIHLERLRGRPVLVTFWATSCVGCVREIPHLIELYQALNQRGLEIIGVAMNYDPPSRVVKMIAEKNIPYPVALDAAGDAALAFGDVLVTPTSFLIAPDGAVAMHSIGEMDLAQLRATIAPMLPELTTSAPPPR